MQVAFYCSDAIELLLMVEEFKGVTAGTQRLFLEMLAVTLCTRHVLPIMKFIMRILMHFTADSGGLSLQFTWFLAYLLDR